MRFLIWNRSSRPYRLARLQALDSVGRTDHARTIVVSAESPEPALLATVPPGKSIRGVVVLASYVDNASLRLFATEPDGRWPLWSEESHPGVMALGAKPHTVHREQVTVHLGAVAGALWLGAGAAQQHPATVATMMGASVRGAYTINQRLTLEGELIGLKGHATALRDPQVRRSTLGRVLASGALGFGDRVRSSVHFGVGAQGGQFTSEFAAIRESSFEVSVLVSVGARVHVRATDTILVSTALSATAPLGGRTEDIFARSVEALIQVGYIVQ